MKGISAIIATILILMIVVALAALAWTWFSGIFTQVTESAGENIAAQTNQVSQNFAIETVYSSATATNSTIRNAGSTNIDVSKMTAYVNSVPVSTLVRTPNGVITPGQTATISFNSATGGATGDRGKSLRLITDTGAAQSAVIN